MSGLRSENTDLRHQSKRPGSRLHPPVELPGGGPLLFPVGELSQGRNLGGMCPLEGWERADDPLLKNLSGPLGPATVLERGGDSLRDQLGMRLPGVMVNSGV